MLLCRHVFYRYVKLNYVQIMKQYDLESKYVLIETDETGAKRIVGTGDDADEYGKFYSLSNDKDDTHTLYIPREDGTVFVIEDVTWFDADYEDNGFILYQKKDESDNELNFAYLFAENRVLELGTEDDGFYINDEEGKKTAAFIGDDRLVNFRFISYFKRDDEFFFETEPGKFRIFDDAYSYNTPEEIAEQPFYSVEDEENGVTIFFQRDGDLYRLLTKTKTEIKFHNAYLTQNEISGRYDLYGFKDGKPFLLGSGKAFDEINGNIRLDGLIWPESSEDEWLLEYEPNKYTEPEPIPEPQAEPGEEEPQTASKQNEPKVTVNGLDDSRYFGAGNQPEKEKKPWWKLW